MSTTIGMVVDRLHMEDVVFTLDMIQPQYELEISYDTGTILVQNYPHDNGEIWHGIYVNGERVFEHELLSVIYNQLLITMKIMYLF